jgi:transcriptional regulator with XRE-family HTH domain
MNRQPSLTSRLRPNRLGGMDDEAEDPLMVRIRQLFEQSGMTLEELGQKMGYTGDVARKSAWQFLNATYDHRVSRLRKFASAVGVEIVDLFAEPKKSRSKC